MRNTAPIAPMAGFAAAIEEDFDTASQRAGGIAVGAAGEGDDRRISIALRHVDGTRLTAHLTENAVQRLARRLAELVVSDTLRALLEETSRRAQVPVHRLLGPERSALVVQPRFAFAWAAVHGLGASKSEVGRALGHIDHTSVLHALTRSAARREADPAFRELSDGLVEHAEELRRG